MTEQIRPKSPPFRQAGLKAGWRRSRTRGTAVAPGSLVTVVHDDGRRARYHVIDLVSVPGSPGYPTTPLRSNTRLGRALIGALPGEERMYLWGGRVRTVRIWAVESDDCSPVFAGRVVDIDDLFARDSRRIAGRWT